MKLYATTTSERASKGQGGNEFLQINIKDLNEKVFLQIDVIPYETLDGLQYEGKIRGVSNDSFIHHIAKGNKQKGNIQDEHGDEPSFGL
jgi:hypothetical protein